MGLSTQCQNPMSEPALVGRIYNVIMNNVRENCLMSGMIKEETAAQGGVGTLAHHQKASGMGRISVSKQTLHWPKLNRQGRLSLRLLQKGTEATIKSKFNSLKKKR